MPSDFNNLLAVAPALVGMVDVDQVGAADDPDRSILFAVAVPARIAPAEAVE